MQRRVHANGTVTIQPVHEEDHPVASDDGSITNGRHSPSGRHSPLVQQPGERKKRRKKFKSVAFRLYYGHDKEAIHFQMALLGFLFLVTSCAGIYKFLGTNSVAMDGDVIVPLGSKRLGGNFIGRWWKSLFGSSASSIYTIPGSMSHIGDKSDAYAAVRLEYDTNFPDDPERSRNAVQAMQKNTYEPIPDGKIPYDIYNCPHDPPEGYPYAWNMMDILENWPPDDPTPRPQIYNGLCVFDYQKDFDKAMNYRDLELPFVSQNDPAVHKAVERWNTPGFMEQMLGDVPHRTEESPNNHFMYWVAPKSKRRMRQQQERQAQDNGKPKPFVGITKPDNWTPPTKMMRMPYNEWLEHANVGDELLGPDKPHWYYRLIGCGEQGKCDRDSSEYLFDELTFFQPEKSLYLREPEKQKGIHCRFGMKGVIAENHFDGSRNSIALMGGSRRYILAHPNQCESLALYPKGHPSGRHSAVDWSNPDLEKYPEFASALANEVVMQPGDVMYLPTNWFHYIISLEKNFQCNTRSGISLHYMDPIRQCGF